MAACAQNFRRLSYVLYAGDKNTFLAQLPAVEEKIVDIVKNVNAPIVLREVYLCMRVLLCRLSAHNLASSWPVLVTEMVRSGMDVLSHGTYAIGTVARLRAGDERSACGWLR